MYTKLYVMAIVICISTLSAGCALLRSGPAQIAEKYFELTKREGAFTEQKKLFTKKLLENLEKSRLTEDYKGRSFEGEISGLPDTTQMLGGVKTIKIQKEVMGGAGRKYTPQFIYTRITRRLISFLSYSRKEMSGRLTA